MTLNCANNIAQEIGFVFSDRFFCPQEVHELLIHVGNDIGISFRPPFAWQTRVWNHKLGTAVVAYHARARIVIVLAASVVGVQ